MTVQHTPGPWVAGGLYSIVGDLQRGGPNREGVPVAPLVARVAERHERAANAFLIAAAPELLAALGDAEPLIRMVTEQTGDVAHGRLLAAVQSAIAKAKGER